MYRHWHVLLILLDLNVSVSEAYAIKGEKTDHCCTEEEEDREAVVISMVYRHCGKHRLSADL